MTDWSERDRAAATENAELLAELLQLREQNEALTALVRIMRGAMDAAVAAL